MPNQDAFAILAEARRMGLELASQESGAADNPNVAWRRLSLAEASVGGRDPTIQAALSAPHSPADPRWEMRLPPPPCEQCAQDHRPGRVYDHPYVHPRDVEEAKRFLEEHGRDEESPLAYAAQNPTPIRKGVEREIVNRIAIYDGRKGYVVKVESPPEWDDVPDSKLAVDADEVRRILRLAKALGVRVKNNSEDEFDEPDQSGRDSQATPASAGDGPRRSPEEAAREWNELLGSPDAPTPESAHAHGDERPDSSGQATGAPRRARTGTDG